MGESDAARTERELAALRGQIDTDLALLRDRLRADLDPRELARRRPVPVLGGAAAAATLVLAALVRRAAAARRRRPLREIDELIDRLGGRIDKLSKKRRARLRESIRREVGEVEMGRKIERSLWTAATAALAALGAALARASAVRFLRESPRRGPENR